jgi:putative tRNA adenosine deaminase-associated protein
VPGPTQAEAYAVLAAREQGLWQVELLPDAVTDDLELLVAAVRQQPGAFALVDVADEFFVVVRVQQGRVRLLLSDVTASAEWDLATQVVDHLGIEIPRDAALERVVPAGDLAVFDDLGLDGMELAALLSDVDAYADELLSALARRLGFATAYERVVDALVR